MVAMLIEFAAATVCNVPTTTTNTTYIPQWKLRRGRHASSVLSSITAEYYHVHHKKNGEFFSPGIEKNGRFRLLL
jgi:hypothetical protein